MAEAHGAAFLRDIFLFVHQVDNRVGCLFVEFGRVRIFPAEHVASVFDHGGNATLENIVRIVDGLGCRLSVKWK